MPQTGASNKPNRKPARVPVQTAAPGQPGVKRPVSTGAISHSGQPARTPAQGQSGTLRRQVVAEKGKARRKPGAAGLGRGRGKARGRGKPKRGNVGSSDLALQMLGKLQAYRQYLHRGGS